MSEAFRRGALAMATVAVLVAGSFTACSSSSDSAGPTSSVESGPTSTASGDDPETLSDSDMTQGCLDVEEAGLATSDECFDAIEDVGRSTVDAMWSTCASTSEGLSETRTCYRDKVSDLVTTTGPSSTLRTTTTTGDEEADYLAGLRDLGVPTRFTDADLITAGSAVCALFDDAGVKVGLATSAAGLQADGHDIRGAIGIITLATLSMCPEYNEELAAQMADNYLENSSESP